MKNMQFNLENFGGYDVDFLLRTIEFEARVGEAIRLRSNDLEKFEFSLTASSDYVHKNITYFSCDEFCEGPMWDEFREAFVDMICKLNAMRYAKKICLVD